MVKYTMKTITPSFTKNIPEQLEPGILYISMEHATAIHLCCCGCSREVVTPFAPDSWKMIFDGRTVSITPSIGNWQFPCRSHYWISKNAIHWVVEETGAGKQKKKGGIRQKMKDILQKKGKKKD
jgi:Family of unknown function (DUF6527)